MFAVFVRKGRDALWIVLLAFVLVSCQSTPPQSQKEEAPSRYAQKQDSAPLSQIDLEKVPDAIPMVEPASRQGNKSPYEVAGVSYQVMPSSQGYRAQGTASWYGAKFHGYLTSNGETYNMFAMSAAHKSLPLPTYLRVTNLDNGRSIIVRVNDRGPFHSDRIIDLSYAAAVKLGYADQGTASVKLEAIDPLVWQSERLRPGKAEDDLFLQVGAFAQLDAANRLKQRLEKLTPHAVSIHTDRQRQPQLHRVQVGPLKDMTTVQQIKQQFADLGLGKVILVATPRT